MYDHNAPTNLIILDDDTAIPQPNKAVGRRGLAGNVFLLKVALANAFIQMQMLPLQIAGAMAEAGKTIEEITTHIEAIKGQCGNANIMQLQHAILQYLNVLCCRHNQPGARSMQHARAATAVRSQTGRGRTRHWLDAVHTAYAMCIHMQVSTASPGTE